jgi:hypothetical protein
MARHSSSPSDLRTNTLVPPITNVERFGMKVPMWKSGPEFKNTYDASMPDQGAINRP